MACVASDLRGRQTLANHSCPQLCFCYAVTALGALWYANFERRAAADLKGVPRDAGAGNAGKFERLEAFICEHSNVVLALTFVVPLFWALDIFWKAVICVVLGLPALGSAYFAVYTEQKKGPRFAGLVLLCAACIAGMALALHYGSKFVADQKAEGSASSGTGFDLLDDLVDEWE